MNIKGYIRKKTKAGKKQHELNAVDIALHLIKKYRSDVSTYIMYKEIDSERALKAKEAANTNAISYNEFVKRNFHFLDGNVSNDIVEYLPVIE